MRTIPFVQEGLGNSSYILDLGNRRGVIVDPDRSVARYVDALRENDLQLAAIFETHLHADFVSGARELASQTEAPIFIARDAASKLPVHGLEGGQLLKLDGLEAMAVASPGHTPEHLSFVFRAASGPPMLFSGGSLIVGGAARTDLISPEMTEPLSRHQFRTLHSAFADLPDETLLYPTHGGGSFCSTGTGQDRTSTLGRERRENPLLSIDDENEFVKWFPTTFPAAPGYFFRMRAVNQAGPLLRAEILPPPGLGPEEFAHRCGEAVVVDARSKEEYARGHIPGSLNNPLRDDYAVWLGWLVPENSTLLFVCDPSSLGRVVDLSLLVGYERFGGWLQGGVEAWQASGRETSRIDLADAARAKHLLLHGAAGLDVREPDEYGSGHIEAAIHVPLGSLAANTDRIPRDRPVVVYCGHGERASSGASLLEASGFRNLVNLDGGIEAWRRAGFAVAQGA
jgi:rhodanese-related sulfurtransferase